MCCQPSRSRWIIGSVLVVSYSGKSFRTNPLVSTKLPIVVGVVVPLSRKIFEIVLCRQGLFDPKIENTDFQVPFESISLLSLTLVCLKLLGHSAAFKIESLTQCGWHQLSNLDTALRERESDPPASC